MPAARLQVAHEALDRLTPAAYECLDLDQIAALLELRARVEIAARLLSSECEKQL